MQVQLYTIRINIVYVKKNNREKYTKEIIADAVAKSLSWSETCRYLKKESNIRTGFQTYIKRKAQVFEIDYSHFVGQYQYNGAYHKTRPIEDYFLGKANITSDTLKKRLIQENFKQSQCEKCGLSCWMGEKIPLELDHIDSNHFNNSLENLKILCPTCHAIKTRKDANKRAQARKKAKQQFCNSCEIPITGIGVTGLCTTCVHDASRRIDWPSIDELLDRLNKSNYSRLAKELGVSDNAIRKHLKIFKK